MCEQAPASTHEQPALLLTGTLMLQVLREVELPDSPTFLPCWPLPSKIRAEEVSLPQDSACERAQVAADIVIGVACILASSMPHLFLACA